MRKKIHIDKAIREIEKELSHRLSLAGEFVTGAAKLLTPVDTGNLRSSISHTRAKKLVERIGTGVDYAPYIELGTRFMRARPYLLPAFAENKRSIIAILRKK